MAAIVVEKTKEESVSRLGIRHRQTAVMIHEEATFRRGRRRESRRRAAKRRAGRKASGEDHISQGHGHGGRKAPGKTAIGGGRKRENQKEVTI